MAYSSIVAVADNNTIEGGGAQFAFTPGDPFPIEQNVALQVRQQYFPPVSPPIGSSQRSPKSASATGV
jgi:hypothetical protein